MLAKYILFFFQRDFSLTNPISSLFFFFFFCNLFQTPSVESDSNFISTDQMSIVKKEFGKHHLHCSCCFLILRRESVWDVFVRSRFVNFHDLSCSTGRVKSSLHCSAMRIAWLPLLFFFLLLLLLLRLLLLLLYTTCRSVRRSSLHLARSQYPLRDDWVVSLHLDSCIYGRFEDGSSTFGCLVPSVCLQFQHFGQKRGPYNQISLPDELENAPPCPCSSPLNPRDRFFFLSFFLQVWWHGRFGKEEREREKEMCVWISF